MELDTLKFYEFLLWAWETNDTELHSCANSLWSYFLTQDTKKRRIHIALPALEWLKTIQEAYIYEAHHGKTA